MQNSPMPLRKGKGGAGGAVEFEWARGAESPGYPLPLGRGGVSVSSHRGQPRWPLHKEILSCDEGQVARFRLKQVQSLRLGCSQGERAKFLA